MVSVTATTADAYKLMHDGALMLSRMEANGMRIDMEKLRENMKRCTKMSEEALEELEGSKLMRAWRKVFGRDVNIDSPDQLRHVLFDKLGCTPTAFTENGKPQTDAKALEDIEVEGVDALARYFKVRKIKGTFLKGIRTEQVNGRLHTVFNLHLARTYRGSSDSINLQNLPVRDQLAAELIRSVFIPHKRNRVLIETDFKGIEVGVAACYHKDPVMIKYITDPSKDMHRDMAVQCFCLEKVKLPFDYWKEKDPKKGNGYVVRYCGKNMFVFPQFYGDYYAQCARSLWLQADRLNLTLPGGISVKAHLAKLGIKERGECNPSSKESPKKGTFERHVQEVEHDFWNNRFSVYGKWRRDWYKQYVRRLEFTTLTGFTYRAAQSLLRRNQVINYPVQGSAFHLLLWTAIQAQRRIDKTRRDVMLVNNIHDSLISDVHEDDVEWYLRTIKRITSDMMYETFKWINVPLEVEIEMAPPGASWFHKKGI